MTRSLYVSDPVLVLAAIQDLHLAITTKEKNWALIHKRSYEIEGFLAGLLLGDPDLSTAFGNHLPDESGDMVLSLEAAEQLTKLAAALEIPLEARDPPFRSMRPVVLGAPPRAKLKSSWLLLIAKVVAKLLLSSLLNGEEPGAVESPSEPALTPESVPRRGPGRPPKDPLA
jgi:hypothetical protein